jgi:hypothetical protein
LTVEGPRIQHPEAEQDSRVEIFGAEHGVRYPRPGDVVDQERRHRQPEDDLRRLPCWHAESPSPVEEPQAEQPVREQRAEEQRLADGIAPEREEPEPSGFHGAE